MAEFGSKLYFRVAFISLLLSLASGDCVDLDLGMENGTILDSEITASSKKNASTPAENGRLNYTLGSSWCAGSGSNPYLQIDLLTLHIICAVSTQGNSQADQWVKTYTLKISKDGSSSSWTDYKEDGLVMTFEGNNDRNSEVMHVLYKVLARYLRFQPKTHHGHVCMRTEVFGVKIKPENLALGKSTAQSSIYNYNSTVTGVSRNAVDGNPDTDFQNGHCSHTNTANPSWWRVDLGANLVPVSEIFIVNRFSSLSSLQQRNIDYKITLGSSSDVTRNDECEGLYSFVDFKASAVCFRNPLITGRYVGIMTTKSQILQLCEVEVYSRENLAFGKPTFQSGTTYQDGKSSKAVDGNSNTHFQYGKPVGSCTLTRLTNNPWWRVDLQQVQYVSEVYIVNRGSECGCPDRFKNFEIRVGMVDDGQSSANPKCGDTYTYPFPVGEGRSFFCHPSLKGKNVIIRFVNRNDPLTLCEVEVYSERRACPMQAIGVASSDAFPDDSFSASSIRGSNKAFKGRLNGDGAWLPSNNNKANDYLEIDLGYEFVICAVATQGNPSADHWTTKYKLQLALIDLANNWLTYQENSIDKEFNGNSGRNDIVKHRLKEYASARFIRFQPTNYKNNKALRVEVFGILISTVPSQAPSGFTVAASSSTSITASWQLPPKYARHGIITGFKLFYVKKASAESPTMLTYNDTSLNGLVGELDKYTEYEFQVLAFSSEGDGPKSSVVVARTKEDGPSKAPRSLSLTPKTSTSIEASWQLPPAEDRNGVITGFKLFYKKKGSSGSSTPITINSGSTLTKVVTGLDKYTEYEFEVLAFTSVGDGPKSSVESERTMEDAPTKAPDSFNVTASSSTSMTASWQLPQEDGRNGNITGFKLFYKKKGSLESSIPLTINSGSTLKKVVSGLDKYTEYEFEVLAFTSVGNGPKSAVKSARTDEDVPSAAPRGLTVTAKSSTIITSSWQLPPANEWNGIIKGFKLYYKKEGSSGSQSMKLDKSVRTTDVIGLSKYTEYEFQILAFTFIGDGPNSTVKSKRTKEDAPSMPMSLTYTLKDQDKSHGPRINLTWSIPAKPNGVIRNYTVFYSYNGNPQREISGIDALSYSVDVLGGATYQFHVRAVTIKPGPNATLTVNVPEYVPSHGPENVSSTEVNYTTFEVTWAALSEKVAHGIIKMYQVRLFVMENCTLIQSELYSRFNTTTTNMVLSGLSLCVKYEVSIRGYTAVGPGPYSRAIILQTLGVKWSKNTPSSPSFPSNSTEAGFTAKIMLPRLPTNARFFQVIVITVSAHYSGFVDSPESFRPQDLETYEEAHESLVPAAYVTFQFSGNDFDNYQEFIVGNGAKSNSKTRSKRSCDDNEQYYNKPLQPNTNYRVFLRAFVTEMLYISSNFVEIKTKEKPAVKKLPEKSILSVGELVLLTCEVTGDPEPIVTWTKNGNSSIPRAQFRNDDRILVIKDVLPLDSGVYGCNASNKFGESGTSTTVIVAVPPRIAKEVSPSSVICERQTLCTFSCYATSVSPFNYSWTKNGQVPVSDGIKIMNNIIVFTPRDAEDYGVYVCHATNRFGSTTYSITLLECQRSSNAVDTIKGDDSGNSVLYATVITLSCIVFVLLVVIGVFIWRLRRALPESRAATADTSITDNVGQSVSPCDQQMPEPDSYMELSPRPFEGQSPGPSVYKSLQGKDKNDEYYNVGFKDGKDEQEEIYHEIGNAQC